MMYEWRTQVKRVGPPILAPSAPSGAQFRSVYAFPETTVRKITKQNSMKDLDGCMVTSDTVLIDVDKEENVGPARKILEKLGIVVHEYTTGNRGVHWHLPVEVMTGVNVIYSQKQWLKSVGLWSLIDTSIYRPAGQFRAIGATHSKTGRVKALVGMFGTTTLKIKLLLPPPVTASSSWLLEEGTPETVFAFYMNLLSYRGMGGRHPHIYILFKSGQKAGLDRGEIEECIHWWNNRMTEEPHSHRAVEQKLKGIR
jgi:hypothetical protein